MKAIFYKIRMRLNAEDEHEVLVESMIPYSDEGVEYAKAVSYDGTYTIGEYEPPVPKETTSEVVNTLVGASENRLPASEQFRKALQMFAASLDDERAMEVATIYDPWAVGKSYTAGEFFTYGENSVGDPQLYKVAQAHTAQADWKPDVTPALYVAIGLDEQGYPVWAQPMGAHDAYNNGDVVNYNGTLYRSLVDGNVYSPEAYPAGWAVYG